MKNCVSVMKRFSFILILLLLPLISHASDDWKAYPYNNPASTIVFPQDEGSHNIVFPTGLEWWYVVIHAVGETTGHKYSILVTHFNNQYRFFTVTDVTNKTHASATTTGLLISKQGSLDLTQTTAYGTDYMRTKKDSAGVLIPFQYEFETNATDMHIKADLNALKPPMMVGGTGYVPIGSAGMSYYYSQTRQEVSAVLTYGGITENITGLAWMDHQWGNFLISPVEMYGLFETYEWFCVQLDNFSEIMISNIYDRSYNLPYGTNYGGIQYFDANGNNSGPSSTFTRTGYWEDPVSGNMMSMGWTLTAPAINLNLVLTPEFKDQMVSFPLSGDFWEGSIAVTGTLDGVPVTGRSFGELMHRFKTPELFVTVDNFPLKTIYRSNEIISVDWTVLNPDAGNPLKYDVDLVSGNLTIPIVQGLTDTSAAFTIGNKLAKGRIFTIKVTASSIDKVIQGNSYSPLLMTSLF